MRAHSLFILAATAAPALADTHTLYAGFIDSGDTVVELAFDDVTNALTLVRNNSAPGASGQPWMAFDSRKKNLYVLASTAFQSYSINEDLSLTQQSNVTFPSECIDPFSGFISPINTAPYLVWGTSWGTNCSSLAMSVDESGTLQDIVATANYSSASSGHGTDLNVENNILYTADLGGNGVWVHSYDAASNTTTEMQFLSAPEDSLPRHLVVHPNQKWVYVIYQTSNVVGVFSRDTTTGLLTDTNTTYSLLPDSFTNSTDYSGDEVTISSKNTTSPKYLYASTRSSTTNPGYVAAWNLDPDTGAITSTAFKQPTTGTGGGSNAVIPSDFSESYFSICDTNGTFVEVWKVADDGSSATAVGHVDLDNGPANAIWYS